jgi:hypothetical protein
MRSAWSPVERAIGLFAAILLVMVVDALKPSPAPADKIDIQVTILNAEKRQDHSIDVTAEIANRSPNVTLAGNRLTVVPETSEGTYHENKDGKNEGGGTASADDPPKDTPVRVLEGTFDEIPPNASVTVAFTVPPETARREPLVVHFESIKLRYENTEEPRAIRVAVPLSVSD